MTEKSESRNIRHRADLELLEDPGGVHVQTLHACGKLFLLCGGQALFRKCLRIDARAERFCENQRVTGTRVRVGHNPVGWIVPVTLMP